jgi:hypothetical protein
LYDSKGTVYPSTFIEKGDAGIAAWDSKARQQISPTAAPARDLRHKPMKMHFRFMLAVIGMAMTASSALAEHRFTPSELRADFTAMYQGLQSAAFDLYAFTPKAVLDRAYRDLLAGLKKPMTLFKAQIRFEEFASLARMGHTRIDFLRAVWARYLKNGGRAFPLTIRVIDGKTIVAQNKSGMDSIARGDQILKMNSTTMQDWLKRTERHVSAETPYMAHSLMEFDFPIYVWVELGEVAEFRPCLA